MIIGSILENQNAEKRIAITPEIVKKYTSLGFEINLVKNYGLHLGFSDKEYSDLGVKFKDEIEILKNANIIIQLGILSDEKISSISINQVLIGVLNPYENNDKLKILVEKKLMFFFRTLPNKSSIDGYTLFQANLAGKVIERLHLSKAIPMMMTGAGTISQKF